jgi:hypothetical protein
MILFEANAVAPLVNLPDAAAEETVQWKIVLRTSGLCRIFAICSVKIATQGANRVYNAHNLFAGKQVFKTTPNLET